MTKIILGTILVFSMTNALAGISCTGSCWSNGCCERQFPNGHSPLPGPKPECMESLIHQEVCRKISVKEALSLEAAAMGVHVFISPDQKSALRCD